MIVLRLYVLLRLRLYRSGSLRLLIGRRIALLRSLIILLISLLRLYGLCRLIILLIALLLYRLTVLRLSVLLRLHRLIRLINRRLFILRLYRLFILLYGLIVYRHIGFGLRYGRGTLYGRLYHGDIVVDIRLRGVARAVYRRILVLGIIFLLGIKFIHYSIPPFRWLR